MDRNAFTVHSSHGPGVNVGPGERMLTVFAAGTLAALALRQNRWAAAALGTGGGILLWRGLSGHCPMYGAIGVNSAEADHKSQHTERTVLINKPPEELYAFWRNFENLPRMMNNLESVHTLDERRSRWRAKAPVSGAVEWEAEITEDVPNEQISWRTVGPARVPHDGTVRFDLAPGGHGTIVRVSLTYQPPAGALGLGVAKLMGRSPGMEIEQDLRRFKAIMEAGEVPTTEGQSHGRQ